MKDERGTVQRLWQMYKAGGITPTFASLFGSSSAHQMAFIRSVMKEQRQKTLADTPLASLRAVVFDLETTGFQPHLGDEIISLGGVAVEGNAIKTEESYYSLVNPRRIIPAEIIRLTGISEQAVKEAPELIIVLQQFFQFVHERILIAHGAGHDRTFLNAALWKTSRVRMTHRVIDTMMIAKWLHPDLKVHDLDTLLHVYDIPIEQRHHALQDSLMTACLWSRLVGRMVERRVTTLGELYMQLSQSHWMKEAPGRGLE